jgi:ParB family chromosome partitioning protein
MPMFTAQIIPMAERKYMLVPIDKIRVLNSRNREKAQFEDNVRSIESIGLLKPIVVNERTLEKDGVYELICGEGRYLAHKQIGKEKIPAEVINCDRKTALLYSLVENIARVPPDTMWYAREMKRMKDAGMLVSKISQIVGKSEKYVDDFITLVEMGEDRLIKGVEQGLFAMSFATVVAKSSSDTIQHVLMDAFDSGMINSSNATRVRNLIELRCNRGKQPLKKKDTPEMAKYSIKDLKRDIVKTTEEKEQFVREAAARENRLLNLLDGLDSLWKDDVLMSILKAEELEDRPQLVGNYAV